MDYCTNSFNIQNETTNDNNFVNNCICRCCLATNIELKPIFNPIGSIPQVIFLFTAVKIEDNDNLPKSICTTCLNHLNKCIEFKQRVESSDFLLRKFLINPRQSASGPFPDHDYAKSSENALQICMELNKDNILDKCNDQNPSLSRKGDFSCKEYGQKFEDIANLNNHQICHLQSPTKLTFTCSTCDETFSVKEDLFVHSSLHDDSNGFICKSCNKNFQTFFKLKRHIPSHFQEKPFKCELCDMRFVEKASLTRHFRVHTGIKPKSMHFCMICNKDFPNRYTLKVHNRSHTGERPWKCDGCDKRFSDFRLLNSHKRLHDETKPFECKECNKSFRHRSTLETHIKVHTTTTDRPYRCDKCKKSFKQSWRLQIHKRKTHNRIHSRRFLCDQCSQMFTSASALEDHLQWHNKKVETNNDDEDGAPKEAPSEFFQCNECSLQFSSRLDLITHQKLTHALSHECFTCFGKWKTLEELVRHKCGEGLKDDFDDEQPSADEMILMPDGQVQDCNTIVNALLASVSEQSTTKPNQKEATSKVA
ncbi:zinc finger protein OZF-like [Episyrphus balteatus]|uniref:zinc finger protein OZF-like n=1 Tax=Episyrphus balteatus TaxID=286459 RepID=UPI0024856FD5|nr:zinc finger protein OZF-like [Episyrphus balteatus]